MPTIKGLKIIAGQEIPQELKTAIAQSGTFNLKNAGAPASIPVDPAPKTIVDKVVDAVKKVKKAKK